MGFCLPNHESLREPVSCLQILPICVTLISLDLRTANEVSNFVHHIIALFLEEKIHRFVSGSVAKVKCGPTATVMQLLPRFRDGELGPMRLNVWLFKWH